MTFRQDAPTLPDPLLDDPNLQRLLRRLPAHFRDAMLPDLRALATHAMQAYSTARESSRSEPILTAFDAWGSRVDRIELTPAWKAGPDITTRYGVLAAGHEADALARVGQFARVYLYHVASEFYTCPLAMTDGAATALKASGNQALIDRAVGHFLSRDAGSLWLSGQWMTETPGGSDVGRTETVARQGSDGEWRLHGRKWFSSAVVGEAALALARPEGAAAGTSTLALFYVETRDAEGRWQGLTINRLKDKLGTRELPTAEVELDGIPAHPVGGLDHGVKLVAPMLNVTRTWNAICAVATIARANALALDYARRREAFGRPLIEQPLHARTLATMQSEGAAAFALAFLIAELLGKVEHQEASAQERVLLRVLTPAAKAWTGKLAVRVASEALECFGGAGYIEDTGLPQLLRDAQVYPIWEGTTNVLALDLMRALRGVDAGELAETLAALCQGAGARASSPVHEAVLSMAAMLEAGSEAAARAAIFTLGQAAAAAALASQLDADDDHGNAALTRFLGLGLVHDPVGESAEDAALLHP
ncbi:acyl-CoA dehydrogenase family protein [Pinirhizobacter soli]|uniref:acyl-CoA dehydrogenase family protein n=1 Tax=Pinirhizobacter soli TaxID=2786953 RepID=UPI002029D314|nr:acyl-CoA dehydrogenase family protein [Pinirhizobacter soli]